MVGEPGRFEALVFLDVDGVLNGHDFDALARSNPIHRDKVALLNGVLLGARAGVVLSSAWRYIVHRGEADLAGMAWLLRSHGLLADALAGVTRPDTLMPPAYDGVPGTWPVEDERGRQVADWLAEHGWDRPYVVVDDGGQRRDGSWTDMGIGAAGHPVVWTRRDVGLTPVDAMRAAAILRGDR